MAKRKKYKVIDEKLYEVVPLPAMDYDKEIALIDTEIDELRDQRREFKKQKDLIEE